MKKQSFHRFLAAAAAAALAVSPLAASTARADWYNPLHDSKKEDNYPIFDFSARDIYVRAGEEATVDIFSYYNFTYFVKGASGHTYIADCPFASGNHKLTFHVDANEPAGTITFFFYVDDARVGAVEDREFYDYIDLHVTAAQGAQAASAPAAVSKGSAAALADGTTGTLSLIRDDTVAMLYDAGGTALASFSVSDGSGTMPTLAADGVVQQDGRKYFSVTTKKKGADTVKISDSDKAVMARQGYAGLYLNGAVVNWP